MMRSNNDKGTQTKIFDLNDRLNLPNCQSLRYHIGKGFMWHRFKALAWNLDEKNIFE